jgi:hypothetical protein
MEIHHSGMPGLFSTYSNMQKKPFLTISLYAFSVGWAFLTLIAVNIAGYLHCRVRFWTGYLVLE